MAPRKGVPAGESRNHPQFRELDRGSQMVSERGMNDRPCSLSRLAGRPLARMNGIGNAIVVLDLRGTDIIVTEAEARAVAAIEALRFDQLMTIHDPVESEVDAAMRIYNTDGSLSAACGNGTRCVAWYLLRGKSDNEVALSTDAGRLVCRREGAWRFSVDMGRPMFRWTEIPLAEDRDTASLDLGVDATLGRAFAISMGNPHAVFFVPETDAVDLPKVGPGLEHANIFPERANISFAQIVDRSTIKLRVWERGAGATLACGTGACAALVAAASTNRTDRCAEVDLPGGCLTIDWRDDDHVVMTGAIVLEFEGSLEPRAVSEPAA